MVGTSQTEPTLRRQLDFASALNALAEATIQSEGAEAIYESMVAIVGRALGVDRALLYAVRLDEGVAEGLCEWLSPGPQLEPTRATYPIAAFASAIGEVARTRSWLESHEDEIHPLMLADGSADALHRQMKIRSLLWFPVAFQPRGFHALVFNQVFSRRAWTRHELAFLDAVSRLVNLALHKVALVVERAKVAEDLLASESRFRALYDNTPTMLFTVTQDGRIESANRFAVDHLGYSAEELSALPVLSLFHEGDRDAVALQVARCFQTPGKVLRWELRKVTKNGDVVWVKETARVHARADGSQAVLIACDDVTEQKRAAEAMVQAQRLESLGVFTGGVAHDFNNLLAVVAGSMDRALARVPEGSAARPELLQAALATQRAIELVRQLLAYSGNPSRSMGAVDVNAIISELGELLHVTVARNASVVLDLAPDLPRVTADATQLRQVVMNLVVNAVEAGDGGGVVDVRTRYSAGMGDEPSLVVITVSDAGAGMDARTRERIFDPFFTTKTLGRGLGLAAVLGIVRGHGGTIQVESEVGRGTTFTVSIPRAPFEAPTPVPPPPRAVMPATATVLVVDDDGPLRRVVGGVLEDLGFSAVLAGSGAAALEMCEANPAIDCVLLDLSVAVEKGGGVLARLRQLRPGIPVVLMSGFVHTDTAAIVEQAGGPVLAKPFTPAQLRGVIASAMESTGIGRH